MSVRRMTLICGLCLLVMACAENDSSTASASAISESGESPTDEEDTKYSPVSGWVRHDSQSAIDGAVIAARKEFSFDDRNTLFVVDVTCKPARPWVSMTVTSYVGDPSEPLPQSAIASDIDVSWNGDVKHVPVGRVRADGRGIDRLANYFMMSQTASNEIVMRQPNRGSFIDRLPAELRGAEDAELNYPRIMSDYLPLAMEVSNGAGAFELFIDDSEELGEIYGKCGAGDPYVSQAGTERIQSEALARAAREEQERQEEEQAALDKIAREQEAERIRIAALDTIRVQCRERGVASFAPGIGVMNCATDFPEEAAEFSSQIDSVLATVKSHPFLCNQQRANRSDIVWRAGQVGLQAASSELLKEWCPLL